MRAFYTIAAVTWDATEAKPDEVVEISRTIATVAIFSAIDPHPALEALGAERLGAKLSELSTTDRRRFTTKTIERTVGGETEVLTMPASKVKSGDIVLSEQPAITFAGDDPADYA